MSWFKDDAPPPPDYTAAAKAQGEANLEAGQQTAALNRPDQYDPNGSQQWTMKPGADPKNPQPGDWIVTNKLNDTQQHLKDQQDALSGQFGDLAKSSLTSIGDTISTKFDPSGLPQASALTKDGLQDFSHAPGVAQHQDVALGSEASRQRVQDALYARSTAMLDPQMKQQSSDLESRLASQGITAGSQAYDREVGNQARFQDDAYARARQDAILAGGAEDTRISNQNLAQTGFNNDNRDTAFSQGMARSGMENTIRGQEFGEDQAMTAANNTLHGNALAEALQQRQLGLNEANALRTGNQVGNYNFQAYGGGGQIAAAPIYNATSDGYNAQLAATNANNAGVASMFKGIAGLGGQLGGAAINKWG